MLSRITGLTILLWIAATAAAAAAGVEVTPFIGLRLGGDFEESLGLDESASFGLIVNIPLTDKIQLELLASRQSAELVSTSLFGTPVLLDVDVEYYQVGAMHEWDRHKIRPFFSGGAGIVQFDPEGNVKSDTRFAFNFGGGAKFFVHEHVGFRVEGRLFISYFDGPGELFCDADGCFAKAGSFFVQPEVSAGLTFKF